MPGRPRFGIHRRNGRSISADRDFVEKAEAAELRCTNVLGPSEVPERVEGGTVAMMHLLHDLAGAFGVVDLRGTGVQVWGAWWVTRMKEGLEEGEFWLVVGELDACWREGREFEREVCGFKYWRRVRSGKG